MNNFMIGMYGEFDSIKFNRDFKDDFYGVEVCLFENEIDVEKLVNQIKTRGIKFGIHFPLRAGISELRDPQFLSLDKDTRGKAYEYIQKELDYISNKGIKPEYILFHYPKPAILKGNFDMTNWRFSHKSEYEYESNYSINEFKKNSGYLFSWLSEKSVEYNFIPVLEFDALNKYVSKDNFLETLLEKYKEVRICLDTGRLHLQSKIDADFNEKDIIRRFAKYTEVVHLWNVKISDNLKKYHFPALPSLKVQDGWAPIKEYLEIITKKNKNVKIMFEHRSELISDEELDSCYSWIKSILR